MKRSLTSLSAFVDSGKAFDMVNQKFVRQKMECYGISSINLSWCTDYLSNRSHRTLANGSMSGAQEVTCGVPQGSVLRPLFFIFYANNVQAAVKVSK